MIETPTPEKHDTNAHVALQEDAGRCGTAMSSTRWDRVFGNARCRDVGARLPILDSGRIGASWVFIVSGVAASFHTREDGRQTLTRFFEAGALAGNFNSTILSDHDSDELVALTEVSCIEFPHEYLLSEYLDGQEFGRYLRIKLIETMQHDIDLLICQTLNDTAARYRFLETRHPDILDAVLKKDIASFLGVTPQGYSRFQRRRSTTSDA